MKYFALIVALIASPALADDCEDAERLLESLTAVGSLLATLGEECNGDLSQTCRNISDEYFAAVDKFGTETVLSLARIHQQACAD